MAAPLVDWSHAEQAHRRVEAWVKQGQVDDQPTRAILVTGLFAVRVTLRDDGFTISTGDAFRPDLDAVVDRSGEPIDMVSLLTAATTAALEGVGRKLKDAQIRAGRDRRAVRHEEAPSAAEIGYRLLVDLQLAHGLETVRVARDAKSDAVFGTFAPGFHGLRVLGVGSASGSVMWPATALASNILPKSQLVKLLAEQGHPHGDRAVLARSGGPRLQRFEVIHAVRPAVDLPTMKLVRGNVSLPPYSVSGRTLDNMSDRLAAHLNHRFTDAGAIRGTYHPTTNRFDPPLAGDRETAIACYAMLRHCRHMRQMRPYDGSLLEMARQARDAVARLGQSRLDEGTNLSPATVAWILLALTDNGLEDNDDNLRDRLGRWLVSLHDGGGGFRVAPGEDAGPAKQAANYLITAALAALFEQTRDPESGVVVAEALEGLWHKTAGSPNIDALPWMAIAHGRAAHLLAGDDPECRGRLADRERAIGDLVAKLCEQQVIEPPRLGSEDVIGGFELVKGPPNSPPNPDWRTAQLLSFLATCMRQPGITQGRDSYGWLLTGALAARFLGQLMIDEPNCYYVQNHPESLGGVRLCLWDNRLTINANAMSLLAVTELQEAKAMSTFVRPSAPENIP